MISKFNSSAIENITAGDDIVTVTWKGDRSYKYRSADVSGFVSALNNVIKAEESVGKFVNFSVRNKDLEVITNAA